MKWDPIPSDRVTTSLFFDVGMRAVSARLSSCPAGSTVSSTASPPVRFFNLCHSELV